jgi:hypothetical protein
LACNECEGPSALRRTSVGPKCTRDPTRTIGSLALTRPRREISSGGRRTHTWGREQTPPGSTVNAATWDGRRRRSLLGGKAVEECLTADSSESKGVETLPAKHSRPEGAHSMPPTLRAITLDACGRCTDDGVVGSWATGSAPCGSGPRLLAAGSGLRGRGDPRHVSAAGRLIGVFLCPIALFSVCFRTGRVGGMTIIRRNRRSRRCWRLHGRDVSPVDPRANRQSQHYGRREYREHRAHPIQWSARVSHCFPTLPGLRSGRPADASPPRPGPNAKLLILRLDYNSKRLSSVVRRSAGPTYTAPDFMSGLPALLGVRIG